ncbi:MAG: magnesium transporter [Verrucomicrobia bacterium]|nr:magnesium transporter [Verrucomicrobiota bacterium]
MEKPISHPADVADQLQRLPPEEAREVLRQLPRKEGAAVLAELNAEAWPTLVAELSASELAELVHELPDPQAVDLLLTLSVEHRGDVLRGLAAEETKHISALMQYRPDSAGGIMSNRFLTLRTDQTVEECQRLLRGKAEAMGPETISYLYVTDSASKLAGIVSMRDLVFQRPDRDIAEIMNRDVKHVSVEDDQERIAQLFEHYHYMALPVLEQDGRLVGIVAANQVIDIVQKEATEDMQLMVGLSGEERALTPWQKSIRRRLPWLCINLATAFLAGAVVGAFETTIAAWTALAIFLPIVAGQGGNAGAQTLTVIIRDMALGELSIGDGKKALLKELTLGLVNGAAIGLIVGLVSFLWKGSVVLGVVVGMAMVLNMIAAAFSGVLVPYTLRAFKIDPALASSILVTTVTDVAGFFFFLGLAALAMR